MARIAAQSKGGYYATPLEMMTLICNRLVVKEGDKVNILDSCCGDGDALRFIQDDLTQKGAKVTSYGNELEKGRFELAKTKLDYVLHGGYEGIRTTPYHCLWYANPPYDEGGLERTEVTAFRIHTYRNEQQMLQKGAVVCFCIPQYVLKNIAGLVSQRLDDVSVYRFTDDYYPQFRQVVIFGYFREPKSTIAKKVRESLKEIGDRGPDALPSLDIRDGKKYLVPAAQGTIEHFRGEALRTDELWKDLQESQVFREVMDIMMPPGIQGANKLKRPPLPFKIPHMGLAITANAVDGNFGSFWLSGYTDFNKETREIKNDDGEVVREEVVYHPIPVARVFHPDKGIIEIK